MAKKESIEALARKAWRNAKDVSVQPTPAGKTLLVTNADGEIKTIAAPTLDGLEAKVQQVLDSLEPEAKS